MTTTSLKLRWPCLLPSIAVAVEPLHNLTGDSDLQYLVDAFTDDLVTDLLKDGSGLSFARIVDERAHFGNRPRETDPGIDYLITGSIQHGSSETLRINLEITSAASVGHRWAGRYEFSPNELAAMQIRLTARISQELHILVLQTACRSASGSGAEVEECLSRAATALKGEIRAEPSAEAQRWFLAALACDPRNTEALIGLAKTCQFLVSQPWWSDTRTAAIAFDRGREALAIAQDLAPRNAVAKCVQGMLRSAAGELEDASMAFAEAMVMDPRLASAHAFSGYNSAFLGRAEETLPAVERAMRYDQSDRRHSIFLFFGGFAELLLGRIEASISLLQKSLERNPTYGGPQLFLMAALRQVGRKNEAVQAAAAFRGQYPESRTEDFEQLWLARSINPVYRAQIDPIFDRIRSLGSCG